MENDHAPLIEIDGGGEEESDQRTDLQERPDVEGDEVRPEGNEIEDEIEDSLPDDVLSDEEKARKAERARKREAAGRTDERETNQEFVDNLRKIFGTVAAPPPQQRSEPPPAQQPPQRRVLTKEQRAEINRKILEEDDGVLKAVEWAREEGKKDALREMGQYSAPAIAAAAEGVIDRFAARQERSNKFWKISEPYFQRLVDECDVTSLATMSREEQQRTLGDMADLALARAVREKGSVKAPASPGVGRGAGGSSGPPRRVRPNALTDKQKKEMMDSAKTPEGKKRMARSIAEIERGVTSSPEIARMVAENQRFESNMRSSI